MLQHVDVRAKQAILQQNRQLSMQQSPPSTAKICSALQAPYCSSGWG